jgi:hypothetical protein
MVVVSREDAWPVCDYMSLPHLIWASVCKGGYEVMPHQTDEGQCAERRGNDLEDVADMLDGCNSGRVWS